MWGTLASLWVLLCVEESSEIPLSKWWWVVSVDDRKWVCSIRTMLLSIGTGGYDMLLPSVESSELVDAGDIYPVTFFPWYNNILSSSPMVWVISGGEESNSSNVRRIAFFRSLKSLDDTFDKLYCSESKSDDSNAEEGTEWKALDCSLEVICWFGCLLTSSVVWFWSSSWISSKDESLSSEEFVSKVNFFLIGECSFRCNWAICPTPIVGVHFNSGVVLTNSSESSVEQEETYPISRQDSSPMMTSSNIWFSTVWVFFPVIICIWFWFSKLDFDPSIIFCEEWDSLSDVSTLALFRSHSSLYWEFERSVGDRCFSRALNSATVDALPESNVATISSQEDLDSFNVNSIISSSADSSRVAVTLFLLLNWSRINLMSSMNSIWDLSEFASLASGFDWSQHMLEQSHCIFFSMSQLSFSSCFIRTIFVRLLRKS